MMRSRTDTTMKKKSDAPDENNASASKPNYERRRILGGVLTAPLAASASASALLSACGSGTVASPAPAAVNLDTALAEQVKTIVVIYGENRSFNNLFANFPGVEKPLSALTAADYQQRDRDGTLLTTLPTVPNGWVLATQTSNGTTYTAC